MIIMMLRMTEMIRKNGGAFIIFREKPVKEMFCCV